MIHPQYCCCTKLIVFCFLCSGSPGHHDGILPGMDQISLRTQFADSRGEYQAAYRPEVWVWAWACTQYGWSVCGVGGGGVRVRIMKVAV